MAKKHTYYFKLRPPSIGTHPKGNISSIGENIEIDGQIYHGLVTYDRKLAKKEISNYDLYYHIEYTKKELKSLYLEFLENIFQHDEDQINEFVDSEEHYQEFLKLEIYS